MTLDWGSILVGFGLGMAATVGVAWYFYARQRRESADAQNQLVERLREIIEAQIAGRPVEVNRDSAGRVIGGHVLKAEPAHYQLTGSDVGMTGPDGVRR
jgi:hypothetical protein